MIHTYSYNVNSQRWEVVLAYTVGNNVRKDVVKTFDVEQRAAAWVSYLNGGNYPPSVMEPPHAG